MVDFTVTERRTATYSVAKDGVEVELDLMDIAKLINRLVLNRDLLVWDWGEQDYLQPCKVFVDGAIRLSDDRSDDE